MCVRVYMCVHVGVGVVSMSAYMNSCVFTDPWSSFGSFPCLSHLYLDTGSPAGPGAQGLNPHLQGSAVLSSPQPQR